VNGVVEIAGPDRLRLDELIRGVLSTLDDSREVITDPHARYWGISPGERSLLPGDDARLGKTRFAEWFRTATVFAPRHDSDPVTTASHV
jgi:hypothetical protein